MNKGYEIGLHTYIRREGTYMPKRSEARDLELLEQIIQKEAEVKDLKHQTDMHQRRLRDIQKSRTYKLAKPFERIKDFFAKLFRRNAETKLMQEIRLLKEDLKQLEEELVSAEEELHYLSLDERSFKSYQIMETLRAKKNSGKLVDFIIKTTEQKQAHVQNYNEALIYAARLFMNEDKEQRDLVYSKVFPALETDEIPEFMMRPGLEEKPFELSNVGSFRGSLSRRIRQKQLSKTELPEYVLEDKRVAYEFIDKLHIRRPKTDDQNYTGEAVPKEGRTVIKPVDGAGSRGVYLIYEKNDIIDVRRSKKLSSIAELEESMTKDLTIGWVEKDEWMVEELILEDYEKKIPARDIKFYSFYGKVGLILEITRFPEVKQCWWTPTGERIRTGKYEEHLFKGDGVTKEELQFAEELSAKIPAPFIRIDFLRSEGKLVFGEFTAKPGSYEEFDDKLDTLLGDYYLDAETRLTEDLLANKPFNEFHEFIRSQQKKLTEQV